MYKVLKIIKYRRMTDFLMTITGDRYFQVYLNDGKTAAAISALVLSFQPVRE